MPGMDGPTAHPHREAELRSIALHRLIASKIRRDPRLVVKARERVERWLEDGGPVHRDAAVAWQNLLAGPHSELVGALTADTELMRDLRQNTPFAGALTAAERWGVIRSVRCKGGGERGATSGP